MPTARDAVPAFATREVRMSDTSGEINYWTDVYLKGQEEFLRRWNEIASGKGAAGSTSGAQATGSFTLPPGWPNWAELFSAGLVGPSAELIRRYVALYEQYLTATRALTEAFSKAMAQPDPLARSQEFANALLQSQSQFMQFWQSMFSLDPAAAGTTTTLGGGLPWLRAWSRDMGAGRLSMADVPALGLTRERQEALQRLQRLFTDYFEQHGALAMLWNEVIADALRRLGETMAARFQKNELPQTPRQLYDLWVECAEAAYANMAHSPRYAKAQAELGNTVAKMRIEQRALIESVSRELDLPTRSELNTVHRRLKDMKAELRRLRAELDRAKPPRTTGTRAAKPRADLPN
jgi:class III poly(R)-hydroxyalkanoic acid synthase PhaE subunit